MRQDMDRSPLAFGHFGGAKFTILLALFIAVVARAVIPPVSEDVAASGVIPSALPDRATAPPRKRPELPTGLALMVEPVAIVPLIPLDGG